MNKSVLVTGIYLAGQKNNIKQIVDHCSIACGWEVVQKWAAIGATPQPGPVKHVTSLFLEQYMPKFVVLNKLLSAGLSDHYDYIIVCDDDISFPPDFLGRYLDLVVKYDFALSQPARTHNSYTDHHFVEQLDGLTARRTRFVEIGPLFSMRRDIISALCPFDERSFMGWGYDFVWPCIVGKMGLRMGIIDATPVEHSMRKPVKNYLYDDANKSMDDYLKANLHLSKNEAFRILESFA